jgi:hypothetical protein
VIGKETSTSEIDSRYMFREMLKWERKLEGIMG